MARNHIATERTEVNHCPARYRIRRAHGDPATASQLPFLFVHGLGCSSDMWKPVLRCVLPAAHAFTLIAPDMPGCGPSSGSPSAFGIAELADWIPRFLDALQIERVHIAGHSMGCQVVLALALRHPDRVGNIVLASPTCGCRYVPLPRYVAGLLLDAVHETTLYNAVLLRTCREMGFAKYLETVKGMMDYDVFDGIDQITAQCLVVRGCHDPIVSDCLARRLTCALPNGVYRQAVGVAHALPFSKPLQFMKIATDFLNENEF